jgi:hypothetical protein
MTDVPTDDPPPGYLRSKKGTLYRKPNPSYWERMSDETRSSILKRDGDFARRSMVQSMFRGRGLSNRTIDALVNAGIDAPEQLLFMSITDLRVIAGIGRAGLGEIAKYRSRFIPGLEEGA